MTRGGEPEADFREPLFGPRLRRVIVGLALLSVLGTFASLLFGEKLTRPRSRARDSFSTGAVGHRAFHDTLQALGFFVVRHREGQFAAATAPLLFIEPPLDEVRVNGDPHDLYHALSARVANGLTTVVVLPKWVPRLDHDQKAASVSAVSRAEVADLLHMLWSDLDPEEQYRPGSLPVTVHHRRPKEEPHRVVFGGRLGEFAVEAPWLQTFTVRDPEAVQVLLGTRDAALVIERPLPGASRLLVVADPDLLHSFNLQRADHAALWQHLLQKELETDTVVIDEVLHGFGQRLSLGSALGSFPLVLLPLHALVLILLGAAAGLARFGPLRRPAPVLGRGPREVIGVAASVFAAGRPASQLARAYVQRVLADAATTVGLTPRHGRTARGAGSTSSALSAAERDLLLDDLAERKGQQRAAQQLAHAATHRGSARSRRLDQEALRLAQRAWTFRAALLGEQTRERDS